MKRLIGFGDSWCWGAELVDPVEELVPIMHSGDADGGFQRQFKPINEAFRLTYRYLNQLANHMGIPADKVEDYSQPSYSNDAIYKSVLEWIVDNDFKPGEVHDDIFVTIGWTSPERAEFFLGLNNRFVGDNGWMEYGPWSLNEFNNPNHENPQAAKLHQFFNLYFELFGDQLGGLQRYIRTVWATEQLLTHYGINYVMHQAFYECTSMVFNTWENVKQREEFDDLLTDVDKQIWNRVNEQRFINKNTEPYTAHSLIKRECGDAGFICHHPSADGHVAWAKHMYKYIRDNNLI